jgi:Dyp-type peroxidase family
MIDLDATLDLKDPEAGEFLRGIQGNIIKGHGRDNTRHLLLRMIGNPQAVGRWIAWFTTEHVTSAHAARRSTLAWRAQGGAGERFAMFLLAPDGYRHLGAQLPLPGPVPGGSPDVHARYFPEGMKAKIRQDPEPSTWEPAYRQQLHAMVLLAHDDEDELKRFVAEIAPSMDGVFEVIATECGVALKKQFPRRDGTGSVKKVIEHFGFQDGVSQPLMIKQDLEEEISKRGSNFWDPGASLSLALVREPGPAGGFGSFMVFRKLEQDVKAFWDALTRLSQQSGIQLEEAGAMAVGRFRDGEPAIDNVQVVDRKADKNDFSYPALDRNGAECPFHAHIRKTNPRGDLPSPPEFERSRRIVRRGITYGRRADLQEDSISELPSEGVGLLFMCFQANLDQFVIQQEGSDADDFARPGTGVDAVIGQHNRPDSPGDPGPIEQTWPSTGAFRFKMLNFVRMRGGEYFFAPSIGFLKGLGQS